VLEGLYDANPLEVPPIMVEDQMDNMMNELSSQMKMQGLDINQYLQYIGQEPTAFRESTREEAEKRVKIRLLIQAVAKQEGYTASEEEVDTELTQMGTQYGMEKDKIREYIGEGQVALIKEDIRNRKAVDYLYETAVVEAE
jgi:trigger factor